MHNEFTCIIEKDEDWYIAYCPEISGANGQGGTPEECRKNYLKPRKKLLELDDT